MSTMRHVIGMLCAGVLAFVGVFTAYAVTLPLTSPHNVSGPASLTEPPTETRDTQDSDTTPPDPGEGLEAGLVGRWASERPTNPTAFLEFSEHGLWFASDGCNQSNGWWRIAPHGAFSTSGGAMTQIGCENDVTITAVSLAHDAEVTGDLLVLTDATGESSRFTRIEDHAISLTGRWIGPSGPDDSAFVTFASDGSWQMSTGCTESRGTWELGPMPFRDVPQSDSDAAVFAASAPGLLRIGSVTAKAAAGCAEADPESVGPFNEDTDYAFGFRLGGANALDSFTITPADVADAADPAPRLIEFTRFAVAAG